MTGRLTRAHRRKIESKTHQKIDLDHLAEIDVKKIEAKLPSEEETETPVEITQKEASVSEEQNSVSEEQESASEQEEKESDSEEEKESEEDDSEEESDTSDDEDLDSLLEKAQEALKLQSNNIQVEKSKKPLSTKISKMETGISNKDLYFKDHTGRSKLIKEAVELLAPGEKPSKNTSVILTSNKDDDNKKLTKKERLIVSF